VKKEFANRYGLLDRWLHRVAFATVSVQATLDEHEQRSRAGELAAIDPSRPVFITSLPRAGTTLLLEMCATLPEFASHCYRDMPFVLCPLLWSRFSSRFQRNQASQERAHGDGMQISLDSPEALEEVIWKQFWPQHYARECIVPWQNLDEPEFREFLLQHFAKIIWLRCGNQSGRYVSKNNLNIARVAALSRMLPKSTFVIPFREPLQHAGSLLAQHRRFLEIHRQDSFARDYMAAIGHFDFGQNLRPVDFDGWLGLARDGDRVRLGFWVEYWIACFRYLLPLAGDRIHFVSYEALCTDPDGTLRHLASLLDAKQPELLVAQANAVRAPRLHAVELRGIPADVLEQAASLHESLLAAAG